jgi:HAD superfamily hydrolase (TIGR01490 family)
MKIPETTLLAIYDMDKTVTRRATYNGFLLHMALNKSPWRLFLSPLLAIGLILFVLRVWDRARLKQFSQMLLIGRRVSKQRFTKYVERHADLVVGKNVYPQLLARVAEEKAAGYRHVMATASYRLYVEAIAKRLGFDDVIATDLSTDSSGHVLAIIDGHNCYDAAKLELVKGWMATNGLSREHCHIRAYSDHVSDAPLLSYADEAFATNPHQPLAEMAKANGWEIIDWR